MIKARIKLKSGEIVTKTFDSISELDSFLHNGGHELIRAIEK
ncbi:hypothetical protein MKX31_28185 [Bacillus sp. FSL M8-0063]